MNKFKSRRFLMTLLSVLAETWVLIAMATPENAANLIQAYGIAVGATVAAYGFTRSGFAGGREETP